MGAIYLHSDLTDVMEPFSSRAFRHLHAVLCAMSRAGTWPSLPYQEAATLHEWGEEGEIALDELVTAGILNTDGATVTIGEPITNLVRNTPPPGWEDGTLRNE